MSDFEAYVASEMEGLGATLRGMRHGRGYTLSELAARSGVPSSTISKIENGQLKLSLVHAINLATALEANLGFLINRDARRVSDFSVVRGHQRARIDLPEMALSLHDLHGEFTPNVLETRLGVIGVGARSGDEPMTHDGEEICHVLEGAIRYHIDGEVYELAAGDTIQFKCTDPHMWENMTPGPTTVLWVFSSGLSF